MRHYEAHGGADITTILHERFETSYKSGRIALADIQSAAAHLAALPQFDPAQSSEPGVIKLGQTFHPN